MDNIIWVLQICNKLSIGGVQSFLMNYYKHIDRSRVQFAFAVQRNEEMSYDMEIIRMGGRIHYLPRIEDGTMNYIKALHRLLIEHPEYKIVHSHMNQRNGIALGVAKKSGVKIRISHSHNIKNCQTLLQNVRYYILKTLISRFATHFWACSSMANDCLHPNNKKNQTWILHNAIEIDSFLYDENTRNYIRGKYGIKQNEVIIGHVGNFSKQKNTSFLIDIIKRMPLEYKLMLVGDGQERILLERKCKLENLNDRVIFTGIQRASDMYQAMDIFALPSLFEGLGMVSIEAMTSGLPVVVSTSIPHEIDIVQSVYHLSIGQDNIDQWCDTLLSVEQPERVIDPQIIVMGGYDIKKESVKLLNRYINLHHNL